ncbi:MAG: hypothetical protein KDA84_23135 [Planctomycetaceae bacterium]|nr:hypothetical protein [Planctomycetaceae bacterium]
MRHHALQIPAGWMVRQNHFYDITPAEALDGDWLGFPFSQDILQLHNDHLRMLLDLGWYPDGDPDGHFRLILIQWDAPPNHSAMPKQTITEVRNGIEYTYVLQPLLVGDPWSHPLVDVSSKDPYEIVTQINDTLAKAADGELGS